MKLAIEGHSTQGSEVIAWLKMLGGMNTFNLNGSETNCYYYIDDNDNIYHCLGIDPRNYIYYTLEEFLEKFPYKVGDKVIDTKTDRVVEIYKAHWSETNNRTYYYVKCFDNTGYIRSHIFLQPYKEETMEEGDKAMAPTLVGEDYYGKRFGYKIPQGYEFDCIQNNEIIIKPKKPQYPKTYKECCEVIGINRHDIEIDLPQTYQQKMFNLFKLHICRDTYWKIAGDEMGLGKPWEPDLENEELYCIQNYNKQIIKSKTNTAFNKILIFPTEEMRDAFYENFKNLIEECKCFL